MTAGAAGAPARFSVRTADWATERAALQSVRRAVFIVEQGIPESEEWDDADGQSVHVLAESENRDAVGTGRLEPAGKIGRVAVLPAWRGAGVGRALMQALVGAARDKGLSRVYLHAQASALEFYVGLGFQSEGPVFDEVGIPHQKMTLAIR